MHHPALTPLQELDQLDSALRESAARPLLLFKHSRSCGVSAEALDELLDHLNARAEHVHYAMVTVQTHRELSNHIAQRLGVRHETPQALLVRDGQVVWSASHFRVNAKEIARVLAAQSPTPRPTPSTTPTGN